MIPYVTLGLFTLGIPPISRPPRVYLGNPQMDRTIYPPPPFERSGGGVGVGCGGGGGGGTARSIFFPWQTDVQSYLVMPTVRSLLEGKAETVRISAKDQRLDRSAIYPAGDTPTLQPPTCGVICGESVTPSFFISSFSSFSQSTPPFRRKKRTRGGRFATGSARRGCSWRGQILPH